MGKVLGWAEKKFFGGWDDMHKLRLASRKRTTAFSSTALSRGDLSLVSTCGPKLWGRLPMRWPRNRRKLMSYYRSCLQRQLYANGSGHPALEGNPVLRRGRVAAGRIS